MKKSGDEKSSILHVNHISELKMDIFELDLHQDNLNDAIAFRLFSRTSLIDKEIKDKVLYHEVHMSFIKIAV